MNLPADFTRNIRNSFGEQGEQWLTDLPDLLEQAARKWDLLIGEPLLLSYNYVCAAQHRTGGEVVLKIGVPNPEFSSELNALRLFNADGCVRLLEADDENYMFLLERLRPGEMLVSLEDDEERTRIACEVMSHLWRPVPDQTGFIRLEDWFAALKDISSSFGGSGGPFPKALIERFERLLPQLFAESSPPRLIHGDFHHYNVLSSERGWLAIDPKGVIGPPEYECGPLLVNPMNLASLPNAVQISERRIAILSERLGFPRERIRDWGFCHAMLSCWWDLAEDGSGGESTLVCAEMFARI